MPQSISVIVASVERVARWSSFVEDGVDGGVDLRRELDFLLFELVAVRGKLGACEEATWLGEAAREEGGVDHAVRL